MSSETPPNEQQLWSAWRNAAATPAIDGALRGFYTELDAAVAAKGPTCWASGRCCKFDDFGHRLYVTGLEVAWFLEQVRSTPPQTPDAESAQGIRLPQAAEHPGACPYQIGGLCSTHAVRPLGCRIFFCQRGTDAWQQDLYEAYLARLRTLHARHGLEYRYLDWIEGLAQAAAAR